MSENHDVAPQESVVAMPSDYEAAKAEEAPEEEAPAEDAKQEEGPTSLDEPNPEAEPEEEEAQADSPEGDAEEAEKGEEEGPEMAEIDFGGNKLEFEKDSMPREVFEAADKFAKDIWADYTKKSQANAETAKTLKARAEGLEKLEGLSGQALDAFTQGKALKAELEQLSAVDMNALWQSNPDQARQLSDAYAVKQAELTKKIAEVDAYETEIKTQRQAELERVSEEGKQVLDRKYKGFSTEIAPKLEKYMQDTHGMSADETAMWAANPVYTENAYKAMLYDQMQAAKQPTPEKSKAKPVRAMKNKGKNTAATDPNKMGYTELGKLLGIPA